MEIKSSSKTNIEMLIQHVRNTPLFRQLVPMEAAAGWPIPFKKGSEVYVKVLFYGAQNKGKGCTLIYHPIAVITVENSTKEIVEYINARYSNQLPKEKWDEAVGQFPHEAISNMTVKEYKENRKSLMELYDKIIECLIDGKEIDIKSYNQFSNIISRLMEPGLKPFYRSMVPKFYENFIKE